LHGCRPTVLAGGLIEGAQGRRSGRRSADQLDHESAGDGHRSSFTALVLPQHTPAQRVDHLHVTRAGRHEAVLADDQLRIVNAGLPPELGAGVVDGDDLLATAAVLLP